MASFLWVRAASGDFSQRVQDLLIGGSLLIVRFDESPTHHPLFVEDISRGVRPSFIVRIENP